jgi:putative drug exporter of the RND superfamily
MGSGPVSVESKRTPSKLSLVSATVTKRPRVVLAVWMAVIGALGFLGNGLEAKLSTKAHYIEGTSTQREHRIVTREFGSENAVVVLLSGPRADVRRQGLLLKERFEAMPRALVLSPWTPGGRIRGLRPSPGEAALVVTAKSTPDEELLDIVPPIRRRVDETVTAPVRVSIAGGPPIIESVKDATERAAELGELIAIPALLIVLLLVFRSVFAAAIPIVVGGLVVGATRGALVLITNVVDIEAFALGAVGMMGLALGVDYSLLVVSRFREEIDKGAEVSDAVRTTVERTGPTLLMAGTGLSLAMLVAPQFISGGIVASVAIAIVVATVLSLVTAIVAVPAFLVLIGTRLDRWSLPRRRVGDGVASRLSSRLSRRPRLVVWPTVFILAFVALWALTLNTSLATVALLPPDDPGRQQQEEVQRALGPGWVAPLEIVMDGRDGPVTTPDRMRALAAFQRHVERDPGVAAMTGFAPIEHATRGLGGLGDSLVAQQQGLDKLNKGLSRVHDGTVLNTSGLSNAAHGARRLDAALGTTKSGAGSIASGLDLVGTGTDRLANGLDSASDSTQQLADGTTKASAGAGRLSAGLSSAEEQTGELVNSAEVLANAMRSGEQRLTEAEAPVKEVESRLVAARAALQKMGVGRDDPQYSSALEAIEQAMTSLTGTDPRSGEDSASTDVVTGMQRVGGQFSLGLYLSERLGKNGRRATSGMERLAKASSKLDRGLDQLVTGAGKVSGGIGQLSRGGEALSPAVQHLTAGAEKLANGIGSVEDGANGLSDGLDGGAQRSKLLTGALRRISTGVERNQAKSLGLDRLNQRSPNMFDSGFLYLASLDGGKPEQRRQAGFLVNLDRGGTAVRMLVIPRYEPSDDRARPTRDRLVEDAHRLAEETNTQVEVGGFSSAQFDSDTSLRKAAPSARLALALITMLILIPVLRSLTVPIAAALLNLVTLAATFGLMALLFDSSLLGGPGYVDTGIIPATIMVVFGLAIDYEVFIFARIREEYVRTGSSEVAITNGLARTAPVVTGAAFIMIVVFLAFSVSSFATLRNFGVAQAIGVGIDAFVIRLVIVPAIMRALGRWAWWMPSWLDRLLPGGSVTIPSEPGRATR